MVTYSPANAPPDSAPPVSRKFGPLAAPLPEVGALVLGGKYRIEELLGVGGMGVVMAAEHVTLGQKVAFKFLAPGRGASVPRFLREARAAACINSEYVARVSDVGELESGIAYMLMERLYGEDLGTYVHRAGPRPVDEAVLYILQACDAIAAAHAAGVIHRDLKPSNLFLARRFDGTVAVKVLDFGISKLASGEPLGDVSLTNPGVMLGSPRYMSPEQVRDPKQVDERTDLWSLGMVLYELLTGVPMFAGDGFPALCLAVVHDPAPPLRAKRPDAPEALEAALLRCVQKDPERRFSSAVELALALAPFGPPRAAAIVAQMARHGGGLALAPASDRPSAPPAEADTSSLPLPVASSLQSCHSARPRPLALALATVVSVCACATFVWCGRQTPKPVRPAAVAVATPAPSAVAVPTAGATTPSAGALPLVSIDDLPRDRSAAPMATSSSDGRAAPPAASQVAPLGSGKATSRPPVAGLSATARKPRLPRRARARSRLRQASSAANQAGGGRGCAHGERAEVGDGGRAAPRDGRVPPAGVIEAARGAIARADVGPDPRRARGRPPTIVEKAKREIVRIMVVTPDRLAWFPPTAGVKKKKRRPGDRRAPPLGSLRCPAAAAGAPRPDVVAGHHARAYPTSPSVSRSVCGRRAGRSRKIERGMKIVLLDDYQDAFRRLACAARLQGHDVTVFHDAAADEAALTARLRDAEAVVLLQQRTPLPRAVVERLPALRLVSQTGRNLGHIDVAACTARGVTVSAGGGGQPSATAELTWGLILAAQRHIPDEVRRLKEGRWQGSVGTGLAGKTLGVYGFGRIGGLVAGVGRAFGMRVLCWGREGSLGRARAAGYEVAADREGFFAEGDVISLHLALNDATRGVVTADDLGRMKPTALLVNTSRAPLLAAGALEAALRAGRPGRAAVDVFEHEPVLGASDPLLRLPNVTATPHLGYVEWGVYESLYGTAIDQILAFAAGEPINVVNPEVTRG